MLVVHHPDQALHDPDTVFRTGKFQEGGYLSPSLGGHLRSFLRAFVGRT